MNSKPAPEIIGAIVGDVFHNLRSALDLMASTLARLNGKTPDDVYFPFAGSADDLDLMIEKRHFDKAGPDAVRLLKEQKPYKGGNLELRAVHDLNIRDKHQELIVQQIRAGAPFDYNLFSVASGDFNPPDVQLVFPPDCALSGHELIGALHNLVQVTAGVIEAFEALSTPTG